MKIVNIAYNAYPEQDDLVHRYHRFRFFYGIWSAVGKQQEVVFLEFTGFEGDLNHEQIRFISQRADRQSLQFPIGIHRKIAGLRPDVVVVHSLLFPLQVILLRLQLGRKVKIVVQHHAEPPRKHPLRIAMFKLAGRCIDRYFFTSMGLADAWIAAGQISSRQKVREIMEVSSVFTQMNKAEARARTGIPDDTIYLWIGHLNANKHPLLAIRAFIRFLAQGAQNVHLYLIFQTRGLLDEIRSELAAHPEAAAYIHLVGKVDHDELQYWCSAADFILSTSYYEGSGVAVCEAMSCGCIPLLTDIPSFRFMTGDRCGKHFAPGNEDALLQTLQESLLMDKATASADTLRQYHRYLSFDAIAAAIQEELASL